MTRRRKRTSLLAAVLAACIVLAWGPGAGSAYACSCAAPGDPVKQLRESDAVFLGEVVELGLEAPDPQDNTMLGGVRFDVGKAWRGVYGDSVVIYGQGPSYFGPLEEGEEMVGSSCTYEFTRSSSYLVYADQGGESGGGIRGTKLLGTSICTLTQPLAEADAELRALGPPSIPETGGPNVALFGTAAVSLSLLLAVAVTWRRWVRRSR